MKSHLLHIRLNHNPSLTQIEADCYLPFFAYEFFSWRYFGRVADVLGFQNIIEFRIETLDFGAATVVSDYLIDDEITLKHPLHALAGNDYSQSVGLIITQFKTF